MLQEHGAAAGGPLASGPDRAILQQIKHANDPPARGHGPNPFGGDKSHAAKAFSEIQRIQRRVDLALIRRLSARERERRRDAEQEREREDAFAAQADVVISALHSLVARSGGSLRGTEMGQLYAEMPAARDVIKKVRLRALCDSSGGRLRFEPDGGPGTIHSNGHPVGDESVGGGADGRGGGGQAHVGGHARRPELPAAIWEPIFKNFLLDPLQPDLPASIVAAATHQHWQGRVRLLRNGQCIVTKEGPAPDEAGAWFVEDGALTLVWDRWYAEGLKPCPPPSPPGCFEYPEHRFTLDFGALHHEWCPTKACRHGADCRRLNCGFWHPVVRGSWRELVAELRRLETRVKNDGDTLALLRTMGQPEHRLAGLRLAVEENTRRLEELRHQLN